VNTLVLATLNRAERLEAMRRGFTSKTDPESGILTSMVVVVVIGLFVVLLLLLLNRAQQDRGVRKGKTPQGLFKEVLSKLKLGWPDRMLLRRVASELRLKNPTVMLLTPKIFAESASRYVSGRSGRSRADMTRLRAIHRQVFGQDLPTRQD
jgi:hypothetical protein